MIICLLAFYLFGCKTSNTPSTPDWAQGGEGFPKKLYIGHEELMKRAAMEANRQLQSDFYNTQNMDKTGVEIVNPLTLGSYAADFPDKINEKLFAIYCGHYGLDPVSQKEKCKKLAYDGHYMDIHMLRKFTGSGKEAKLSSALSSCNDAQGRIKAATLKAHTYWREGDLHLTQFFLGLASHTIQDSFCPAHVYRSGADGRTLEDLCFYVEGLSAKDAASCKHKINYEFRDIVWQHWFFSSKLKKEAQYSVDATAAYLVGFAKMVQGGGSMQGFLDDFFHKGSGDGYLNCQTVKN